MKNKINKEELEQELLDFAEGRMDFDTFRNLFFTKKYDSMLDIDITHKYPYFWDKTVHDFISNFLVGKIVYFYKDAICTAVALYLEYNNIPVKKTTQYYDEIRFRHAIQPSYVYIEDTDFLNSIIQQAPEGMKKGEKKKWLKEKIKSMFKYDVKPPRWIQDPEWPIVNGKPLVFKSQTRLTINDERVFYTFYDPDTLEETVIMQFF